NWLRASTFSSRISTRRTSGAFGIDMADHANRVPPTGSARFRGRRRYHRPRDEHKREAAAISARSGAPSVKVIDVSFHWEKTQKVDTTPGIVLLYLRLHESGRRSLPRRSRFRQPPRGVAGRQPAP